MERALIAARKSNKVNTATGEGIGITTQDERSRAFCERMGWDVAGVARDIVSGRVAPVDRRDLGECERQATQTGGQRARHSHVRGARRVPVRHRRS